MSTSDVPDSLNMSFQELLDWIDSKWVGYKWSECLPKFPEELRIGLEEQRNLHSLLSDAAVAESEALREAAQSLRPGRKPSSGKKKRSVAEGGAMRTQFEAIEAALALLPKSCSVECAEAIAALRILYATLEVQGARIIQLNNLIPIDERGYPLIRGGSRGEFP